MDAILAEDFFESWMVARRFFLRLGGGDFRLGGCIPHEIIRAYKRVFSSLREEDCFFDGVVKWLETNLPT